MFKVWKGEEPKTHYLQLKEAAGGVQLVLDPFSEDDEIVVFIVDHDGKVRVNGQGRLLKLFQTDARGRVLVCDWDGSPIGEPKEGD